MYIWYIYVFLPKRVKKRMMMRGALCIHRELELNNKKKCINPFASPSVKYELIKIYIFYVCACFKLNFHVINIINLHISVWAFLPSLCSNFSNSAKISKTKLVHDVPFFTARTSCVTCWFMFLCFIHLFLLFPLRNNLIDSTWMRQKWEKTLFAEGRQDEGKNSF